MTLEQIKSAPRISNTRLIRSLSSITVAGQRRGAALVAAVRPIARARTGVTRG